MRFLIDRCAGTLIAAWLRTQGHDVVESRELGADPGDRVLLELAAEQSRILITIDTDFGQLVFLQGQSHSGLIRLPDVPSDERVLIIKMNSMWGLLWGLCDNLECYRQTSPLLRPFAP